jgi:hypothetical protein
MASMNPELAAAIIASAKRLGVDPLHIATTISYETGGRMDPNLWGGKNNNHLGLIQFGEPERAKYGVKEGQTAVEQMGAVEAYLRDRGVKPGMGLMDIYSTVNAGRPGLYGRSDTANGGAPGTVADKVNNQMAGHMTRAEELLGMRAPVGALATGAPTTVAAVPGAPVAAPAAVPGAPLDITPQAVGALPTGITADSLKGLAEKLTSGQKPEEFAPLQQIQMPQANFGQSQQIAAALAKAYGIGA